MTMNLVVEMSGAHGGSLENAMRIVDAAKEAGATAVKTQAFDPAKLARRRAVHPRLRHLYTEKQLRELYERTVTPSCWLPRIRACAHRLGLEWYSSFFDPDDADVLKQLGSTRLKISSFEYSDKQMLSAAAATGLPLIISVPSTAPVYITHLIATSFNIKRNAYTLLFATRYPTERIDYNMERSMVLSAKHGVSGLSDHRSAPSPQSYRELIQNGATMIERHIRLPDVSTPDDSFASTPDELATLFGAAHDAYRNLPIENHGGADRLPSSPAGGAARD
jgi:pseudaminic acid synthase